MLAFVASSPRVSSVRAFSAANAAPFRLEAVQRTGPNRRTVLLRDTFAGTTEAAQRHALVVLRSLSERHGRGVVVRLFGADPLPVFVCAAGAPVSTPSSGAAAGGAS